MSKVLILVEGQTEKEVVLRVLAPHLAHHGVWAQPKVLTTKRVRSGPDYKGGVSSYALVRDDIDRLLRDTSAAVVTTIIDFYGLPRDFPGWKDAPHAGSTARVAHVEAAWRNDVNHVRFEPHLVLHETEALIFSDPMACELAFPELRSREALATIRRGFRSPEDIDEGPATAPSKRLIEVLPDFDKVVLGPLAIEEIGLEVIRSHCPHFDGWLRRLEALGHGASIELAP
jgi:hypothetical protein